VELDRTRIAIRERGYLEILDLSLHVIRTFARPLTLALAAGVLPAMVFNGWLLAGYAQEDYEIGVPVSYIFWMLVLVLFEAPLVTAPVTLYLGRAVFTERPSLGELAGSLLERLPQLLLFQGLLRPFYFPRRYLNEVILLDRNPLVARDPRQKSTRQRAAEFHHGEGADLTARAIFSMLLGLLLFFSIWSSIFALRAVLLSDLDWDLTMFTVGMPATLWIVIGLFTVARFLGYLDLRIRREGWEVELMLRAEGDRLVRQGS